MAQVNDVAVIMSARNEEKHIGRALRSLLDQSYPCQIIVVDDGSEDNTGRIAREHGVTVFEHEHSTLPAALNVGLRAATTRWVVRVDADDYVHHDFIRVLALFLEWNPDWQAVACDYLTVDEHERHLGRHDALLAPIACAVMFRRDRLVELGLYDESYPMAEEVDLWRRFTDRWEIHRCALPLYRYRRHNGSLTVHSADEYALHADRARTA